MGLVSTSTAVPVSCEEVPGGLAGARGRREVGRAWPVARRCGTRIVGRRDRCRSRRSAGPRRAWRSRHSRPPGRGGAHRRETGCRPTGGRGSRCAGVAAAGSARRAGRADGRRRIDSRSAGSKRRRALLHGGNVDRGPDRELCVLRHAVVDVHGLFRRPSCPPRSRATSRPTELGSLVVSGIGAPGVVSRSDPSCE